ncbi:MAG: HEAT repeat domain-containing protein [Planctomycetes bacterium]|nr:HEAT repeat domain-containing protein [Planctomycetota bacterium]
MIRDCLRPCRCAMAALTLLLGGALAPFAPAQRPRSAEEAIERYRAVQDRPEAQRRRAVDDLGAFADDAVTELLVAELERAEGLGHRQTVVRALGEVPRRGAVPALQKAFTAASNARLADSAAEGLARQGEDGVQALRALLDGLDGGGSKWNSLCSGLGRSDLPAARDLLLDLLRKVGGRERLGPLRNLQRWDGDAAVDEQRLLLARDQDPLVAATALRQLADHGHADTPTLALELQRRLGAKATGEQHEAVVRGLLAAPTVAVLEPLLASAAAADDPFADDLQPLWQRALAEPAFAKAFAAAAAGKHPPAELVVAARALQFVPKAQAGAAAGALVALLGQRDAGVVRAAAAALAAVAPDRALAALPPLVAAGADPLPAIALEALHAVRSAEPAWADELLQHANGRSQGLRAAALQLLARQPGVDAARAVAAAGGALGHKSWPVRAAAIGLLVALREPAGIPLLFERLDAEQARLRGDVVAGLRELTGLQLPTTAEWRQWWAKEGPTFVVPARAARRERNGADAGTTASYWDLPVLSDRVAFVVDCSGSMKQPFGTGDATRLDEAKRQLARVLAALPAKAKANVVTFGNDAKAFADKLQPIDERRRKAAASWVEALEAFGATNVHAALQLAFADPEVDTIYLLTDGRPSAGAIVAPDPLAREVQRWNTGRGVQIHTVALGGRSDFLERLAVDSGGEHTVAR